MTKRQDLCLQRRSRPEQSDQRQPTQAANISHQPRASPNSTSLASRIEFPKMTAVRDSIFARVARSIHHGVHLEPCHLASSAGNITQTSVQTPATISVFRPVARIVLTKSSSSKAFTRPCAARRRQVATRKALNEAVARSDALHKSQEKIKELGSR